MMNYPYTAPCSYFLVYVYEIPGSVDRSEASSSARYFFAAL